MLTLSYVNALRLFLVVFFENLYSCKEGVGT